MKTMEIPKHSLVVYSREEFLQNFNMVIDGQQYSFMDPKRPHKAEEDAVVRISDGKKFLLAPLQPREVFKTGEVVLVEA